MLADRRTFMRLVAAAISLRQSGNAAVSQQQNATMPAQADPFTAQVLEDCAAALRCALYNVGDRLGIFRTLADSGPSTASELAGKTGLNSRILREWLNAMAAATYIEYRPADKTYVLTKEHSLVLADEDNSASFLGGVFQCAGDLAAAAPALIESLRTGKPLTMSDYPADFSDALERESAPFYKHLLVQNWIPLLPQVQEKLTRGGSAADLGCGTGLASITLAKAFPKSRFAGYDPYAPSIRTARERARKEGVSDRVDFVAADSSKLPRDRFDLVTIFRTVHHFSDPVRELSHCRQALTTQGTCFIQDADLPLNPEDNRNTVGRLGYGFSTLYCLHDSLADGGPAFGMEFNEQILRVLAEKSGFSQFRKLRVRGGGALYELRA
jgi:SAM-dependent methyltransferase